MFLYPKLINIFYCNFVTLNLDRNKNSIFEHGSGMNFYFGGKSISIFESLLYDRCGINSNDLTEKIFSLKCKSLSIGKLHLIRIFKLSLFKLHLAELLKNYSNLKFKDFSIMLFWYTWRNSLRVWNWLNYFLFTQMKIF